MWVREPPIPIKMRFRRPPQFVAKRHRANIVGPPIVAARIKGFHRVLPFRGLVFGLREFCDVATGVLQRDKFATTRERYLIFERSFPTPAANEAIPSCRIRF
jgi:hypothetical protein